MFSTYPKNRVVLALTSAAVAATLVFSGTAAAQTGGAAPPSDPTAPPPTTTPVGPTSGVPWKAKMLPDGSAVPPINAPANVVNAIAAGNAIRTRPYLWGGGHASFFSSGYDCSGAVSYVLHGAGLLASPLPSGPLMSWGVPLRGTWITVVSKPSHVYMVVAGLRFDTSAARDPLSQGKGPRWRAVKRSPRGYAVRHYPSL